MGERAFLPVTSCGLRKTRSGIIRRRAARSCGRWRFCRKRPLPVVAARKGNGRNTSGNSGTDVQQPLPERLRTGRQGARGERTGRRGRAAFLRQRGYLFFRQADRQLTRGTRGRSGSARNLLEAFRQRGIGGGAADLRTAEIGRA